MRWNLLIEYLLTLIISLVYTGNIKRAVNFFTALFKTFGMSERLMLSSLRLDTTESNTLDDIS